MNIAEILRRGHARLAKRSAEAEATKKGTLRGGTVGAITPAGLIGKCHRVALARYLGFQEKKDDGRLLMFDAGFTNEDSWYEVLTAGHDGPILREEEIPVQWTTTNGVPVTGRPDMVLCDPPVVDGGHPVPKKGLELKLVCSVGTMVDVLARRQPKGDHLLQAGHYMHRLGIDWELWYTSRMDWPIVSWAASLFVRLFRRDAVFQQDLIVRNERGGAKKVRPFYQGFKLDIRDGRLYYAPITPEGVGEFLPTEITTDGITEWYEYVARMHPSKDLGPRPSGRDAFGERMPWDPCNAEYCPFSAVCARHEENYDDWVAAVEEECK